MPFSMNKTECLTALQWYEHAVVDSYRYGGAVTEFPEEQAIVAKLKGCGGAPVELTDFQLELVGDWMDKAVQPRYGPARFVTPHERALHERVRAELAEGETRPAQPGSAPVQPAGMGTPGPDELIRWQKKQARVKLLKLLTSSLWALGILAAASIMALYLWHVGNF
jgi:hypothetical protein